MSKIVNIRILLNWKNICVIQIQQSILFKKLAIPSTTSSVNMLHSASYYRFLSLFYAYCAIGSGLFTIIFAIMTCATRFRQKLFVLSTLGMFLDTVVASIASFMSAQFLEVVKLELLTSDNLSLFGFCGFLLSFYVLARICILTDSNDKNEWSKGSLIVRACYIVNFLFSGTVTLMIIIHCSIFAGYLIWIIVKWPLEYIISDHKSMSVKEKSVNHATILFTATNVTKMMDAFNTTIY